MFRNVTPFSSPRALVLIAAVVFAFDPRLGQAADDSVIGARFDDSIDVAFPATSGVVDVTKAPYFARGDGRTDDTAALQQALDDVMGLHKVLYFPAGTYLVSKTLTWKKKNSAGRDAWGKNYIQGRNVSKTIIRLQDGVFTDEKNPQSIMWCGGFGSADWFHNYIQDVTFDVGRNNPGAIGLQFYSNNSGAVRDCRILAAEGSGLIGLDLGHRDMNGPLLVRNCEIVGFRRGVATARAVNGQTFERLTLRGQTEVGFENAGQSVSVRGLLSDNAVPALKLYGFTCVVDSKLIGRPGAESHPAVINYNHGRLFLRDVETSGYRRAVGDVETPDSAAAWRISGPDKPGSAGPLVAEYSSHPPTILFPSPARSLRLEVKESPDVFREPTEKWANVDDFGADPTGEKDSSAAIQKAIDSGARTVFLPGSYALDHTVLIRGAVRRLVGL
ncbi:MAG TPA: glycosyl hydrolase family 28-related protein, partial [Pirellulales bacterium]